MASLGNHDIVMLTRQNLCTWAMLTDRWSDREIKLVNYSTQMLLPDFQMGARSIVFANENEIKRFLAAANTLYKPVQDYVRIMRSFGSQASVMTLEELAEEMDSHLPGTFRVPLHKDLLKAVFRESGRIVRNSNRRFYFMDDDLMASKVISAYCLDPESVSDADRLRSMRWLSYRAKARMIRSGNGVFTIERCVRPTVGYPGPPVPASIEGTTHYAVEYDGNVRYAVANLSEMNWLKNSKHEFLELPVVYFEEAQLQFERALPPRKKSAPVREIPIDLLAAV